MKIEVKEAKPVDPPKEYILTLSQDEADMLRTIIGSVDYAGKQDVAKLRTKKFVLDLFKELYPKTTLLFYVETNMEL